MAPTRELAQQIVKVITSLGDFMNIKIHACKIYRLNISIMIVTNLFYFIILIYFFVIKGVGGTNVRDDIRTLSDGVHVVVVCLQELYLYNKLYILL